MKSNRLNLRLFCAVAMCAVTTLGFNPSANASIFRVDGATGDDDDNGSTWALAYATLFKALEAAGAAQNPPHEIWVAAGTYYPDDGTASDDDQTKSFDMVEDVAVYGGFDGTETDLDDRKIIENETILSGEIGSAGNTDNSQRVVYFKDLTGTAAILDGFTVRDGYNDDDGEGGGIEIESTVNAIVRNCFITENEAQFGGGGLAVYINAADGVIEIRNCDFYLNKSQDNGGAVIIKSFLYDVSFINCSFRENEALAGGAVSCATSEPVNFINCEFTENTATGAGVNDGGAVLFPTNGGGVFVNCLIAYNDAELRGGGIRSGSSDLDMFNCTVVKNNAGDEAGGVSMSSDTTLDVVNSIFWDNTDDDSGTDVEHAQINSADTVNVSYSYIHALDDYQDAGNTNIGDGETDHPGFIEEDGSDSNAFDSDDDFRLLFNYVAESLCVDTGDSASIPPDNGDLDGDSNTTEDTPYDLDLFDRDVDGDFDSTVDVDMGAYEFESCIWDLNNDCVVDTQDLLALFAIWGDPGIGDFDNSGGVDTQDLLAIFANWGDCYCAAPGTIVMSFEDELDDACISEAEWDDYEDIMANGTEAEKENYQCWMLHWINDCDRCTCLGQSGCPGHDPFGG